MAVEVYRFDNAKAFPVLENESTGRGRIDVRVEEDADGPFLHLTLKRDGPSATEAAGQAAVVLGLPLIAVDGAPEEFELDVRGDAGGCHLTAEAADAWGWGFAYSFGRIDFAGWRTCRVDAQRPSEFWGDRQDRDTSRIMPPIQLFRLRLLLPESCRVLDVGLRALRVTGRVRLASPGLAGDPRG